MIKIENYNEIKPAYDGESKRIVPRRIYLPNFSS